LELDVEKYKNVFNLILDNLRKGKAVYFHCIWGADRTGALAFLLEGLMGLTPDQMYKDYELTSFSIAGTRKKEGLDAKLTYLNGKYTGKQQDRFLAYWRDEVGIPEADLKDFIRIMVGDGTADGIEQTTIGRQADMAGRTDGRIYDLTGRSMGRQGSHLPQGIYIKDGKKFVVK
jgi:protein tyrosine/serine phosphatase